MKWSSGEQTSREDSGPRRDKDTQNNQKDDKNHGKKGNLKSRYARINAQRSVFREKLKYRLLIQNTLKLRVFWHTTMRLDGWSREEEEWKVGIIT